VLCLKIDVRFWFGRLLNSPSNFVDVLELVSPLPHVMGIWVTRGGAWTKNCIKTYIFLKRSNNIKSELLGDRVMRNKETKRGIH
jgi:hypothetical protein